MIAEELEISPTMVYMSLPYGRTVYALEDKTSNAKRCDRAREKRKTAGGDCRAGVFHTEAWVLEAVSGLR